MHGNIYAIGIIITIIKISKEQVVPWTTELIKPHLPQIYTSRLVDFGVYKSESFEGIFSHSWDICLKSLFSHHQDSQATNKIISCCNLSLCQGTFRCFHLYSATYFHKTCGIWILRPALCRKMWSKSPIGSTATEGRWRDVCACTQVPGVTSRALFP